MRRLLISALLMLFLQACTGISREPEPGIGEPVTWDQLAGWQSDRHAEAWPALLASCHRLDNEDDWRAICRDARDLGDLTDARARAFFESRFRPHPVIGDNGSRAGLITGYYEPLLRGSLERTGPYLHALHEPPDDLLRVDMGDTHPELGDLQLRGRLQGRTVAPYPPRGELAASPGSLAGSELLWVDDPIDAFFLHVQGSGRVLLPDGRTVALRYADHNGHPYRSIGGFLIRTGELAREDVNLFSIRNWLRAHPGKTQAVLNHNPRYIFFQLDTGPLEHPKGALNVPLTPGRSLAVDRDRIPLGVPVWLSTRVPGQVDRPLNRLMMAQDTGSAIKGWNRGDVVWGLGQEAERLAGMMKESGRMFVLLPR
jgi:membrane-bound lytic murein transglycosylase A